MPSERPHSSLTQLDDVFLAEVNFRRNPKFDFDEHAGAAKYALDAHTTGHVLDEDRKAGQAILHATVDWQIDDRHPQAEHPFDLQLMIVGIFDWMAPEMEVGECREL